MNEITTDEEFLPEDYEVPSAANGYMKFLKGENRFRILSSPILGYEWWVEVDGGRKPRRVPLGKPLNTAEMDDPDDIKHFWAMVVFNYDMKRIQILEITQKGIQKKLKALAKDDLMTWFDSVRQARVDHRVSASGCLLSSFVKYVQYNSSDCAL